MSTKNAKKKMVRKKAAGRISRKQVLAFTLRSLCAAAFAVAILAVYILEKPDLNYRRALRLGREGSYDEAMALLSELEDRGYEAEKIGKGICVVVDKALDNGDFDRADSLSVQVRDEAKRKEYYARSLYGRAAQYEAQGLYAQAARAYYEVYDYRDGAEKYQICRCAQALDSYLSGNEAEALRLLSGIPDPEARIYSAALLVTGSPERAAEIRDSGLFTMENLAARQAEREHESFLAAAESLPLGRIAAGRGFTVAIGADGTVLAAGDNSSGQLGIAGTKNAVMVAAGTCHAAVLKKDGTVAAFGGDKQGQCRVSEWKDIVYIACSGYDTIGVRADGSVVAAGMHTEATAGWHDVKNVCGGGYTVGCLNENGTMASSSVTAKLADEDLICVSVCGPTAAGIRSDETLVTTVDGFPRWEHMVSVKVGSLGVFGIDMDGAVHSYYYRASDAEEITLPEKAIEIEVCGTHIAVLGESGKVYCFGDDRFGQCATEDWQCAGRE